MDDINTQVIEDFRADDGAVDHAVGGFFEGKHLLILHNTGAKTGKLRMTSLVSASHGGSDAVAANKGGAPNHRQWFLNVRANPDVIVEGTR